MKNIYLRNDFLNHYAFIEHFISILKPENYLEIGIAHGEMLQIAQKYSKKCYAVDINIPNTKFNENVILHNMTSDQFFNQLDRSIFFDFVFIDGDHKKEQVLSDFLNIKDNVVDDGFVFLHDTYPMGESWLHETQCNNAWEAALEIKQNFNTQWEIVTLPFNPGITIMKKMNINKQILWR